MKNIEAIVRNLLKEKDMSIVDLANEIKRDKSTIYNIFSGRDTKISTLENIATALDTSVEFLLTGGRTFEDDIEEQLINDFRSLDHDNKIEILGELSKLLTKQNLTKKD